MRPQRAWRRARKFREGGKNITFLTYDGAYDQTDKVLSFIQQFDAAFGGEDFTDSSKLRHVSMYLQKSARKWTSLETKGIQPRTWRSCRLEIMKQFLTGNVRDDVLTAWRALKLEKGEGIQKYVDNFWDLHLKASIFENIEFSKQRQQDCAGLLDDVCSYIMDRKPKTISEVIHRSMVAMRIFSTGKISQFNGDKGEKVSHKEQARKDHKGNGKSKEKEKNGYKGSNCLSTEELDKYRKENHCFKCGETGHPYRACPNKHAKKELPQATQKGAFNSASQLCFAWEKVKDQNSLILFDPISTHNFISVELAQKVGIQTEEMGPALEAMGAFKGQQFLVPPLIGKLRIHVQSYVDQEEFFISPLSLEDVILGAPWFHRMAAKLEFSSRIISFNFRNRDISIMTKDRGNTIPIVSHASLQKSIKKSLFAYLIFVNAHESSKESNANIDQVDQMNFIKDYKDCFSTELPKLPSMRGDDDHRIDLIPESSPPNRAPYRVSYA